VSEPAVDPRVVLLGRSGCHLCDEARVVVADVCSVLGQEWVERDIDHHLDLRRRYTEVVPVVLVDGVEIARYRLDRGVLRNALVGS
jgi:hypothetical protein